MQPAKVVLMVAALAALSHLGAAASAAAPAERLQTVTVHSDALAGNLEGDPADRQVTVYLPPGYAKSPAKRYPVLYLLHGYTDSDDRWFGRMGKHFVDVPSAVDRAYAAGSRELIIVMPNAYTRYQGSMYSNSAVTGDWERFIARELVAYIDGHYRTIARREARGLAGHSMGGYGTVRIGMKYPEVFRSLYAMSPCCMGASLQPSADAMAKAAKVLTDEDLQKADFGTKAMLASAAAWSPNPKNPPRYFDLPVKDGQPDPDVIARWVANAPLAMATQYIPALKRYDGIVIDAGDRDVGIAQTVRQLDRILSDFGVSHEATIYEGDHVSAIDARITAKVLPFFSARLQGR
jgi:enterochelin esterase-like enzyme